MARSVSQITIPIKYLTNTKALGQAQSKFASFGLAVGKIAAVSTAAIAGIGVAAVKMAAEMETSFAKIQGLVGVSADQIGELEEAAARLGPQFGKSATEAADALFFITSAGLRGKDAIDVLEASLKGAAIGLGETKVIADLATSAVNAYGAANLSGTKAVDVLTEAVREGKLEPDALAQSMGNVLPVASALGVGFDEVGAAMAAMSRTGTDAFKAATQLRGIMNTLIKPSAEAERTLAGLGLSSAGLREQLGTEGLLPTLETLTAAFDGNIEATGQVFGNVRALTGVLDLMGANVEGTRAIFANMTDDVGALDHALEVSSNTAQFKFDRAMATAKAALLPVGDTLLDISADLLDKLMPGIESLGSLMEETFFNFAPAVDRLFEALPGVLEALSPLLPIMGDLSAVFLDLITALLPPFVALLELAVPILEMLVQAAADFIVPLVEGLAPVLTMIIESLQPLIEELLPIFLVLFQSLAEPILKVIEALVPLLEIILPVLTDIIENAVVPALLLAAGIFENVLPWAIQFWTGILEGHLPFIEGFVKTFGTIFNVIVDIVYAVINGVTAAIEGFGNFFIDAINKIISGVNALREELGKKPIDLIGRLSLQPIEKPGKYDFMTFMPKDTTGVTDLAERQLRLGQERATSLAGGGGIDTSSIAGLRKLLTRRGFYTDTFGNTIFGDITPFADGGIVTRPTIGLVGEAGPEAIVPLRRGGGYGTNINITVNAGMGTNGARVGEEIVRAIKKYERQSGPVFVSA